MKREGTISETDLILQADGSVYHLGVKPGDVSPELIVVGDPERVPRVSKYFDQVDFKTSNREFVTHTGRLRGKRISVISTGIGTDNVEIFFHELDALFNLDLPRRVPKEKLTALRIIRVGTSGALQPDIAVGSFLISEAAIGLDNLVSFYRFPQDAQQTLITKTISQATGIVQPYLVDGSSALLKQFGAGMLRGTTITCPGFYAPQGRSVRLPIRYPELLDDLQAFHMDGFRLTNFEMETSCYYAMGKMLGHEVVSVNAILANRPLKKFSADADAVIDQLIRTVLERF